jgi:hypothetical protein
MPWASECVKTGQIEGAYKVDWEDVSYKLTNLDQTPWFPRKPIAMPEMSEVVGNCHLGRKMSP